jgi:DNA-binding NtrC family response regulator
MISIVKNPLSEENKFEKLKETCDDVLIVGPSGAGKGYLAKLLHTKSVSRADKNFVHVNSASVNSTIFESEMFGHIKGSFTGAHLDKEGYCGSVKDGDLFLDEIGDLSLELQAKLLVLLGDRIYMPVGSCQARKFDGRIIAATNKNLKKEVAAGKFREDLYYRLSNFVLNVRALCEQEEKIPELIDTFLAEEKSDSAFDKSALQHLCKQEWKGNVRQLKAIVKRIVRYGDDKKLICKEDLLPYLEEEFTTECENDGEPEKKDLPALTRTLFKKLNGDLHMSIKLFIEYALSVNNGNITATAQNIKLGRKTLERMLKRYGVSRSKWEVV